MGLIPGSGRPPEEGTGSPLQHSCPEIPWTEEPGGLQARVAHLDPTTSVLRQKPHPAPPSLSHCLNQRV